MKRKFLCLLLFCFAALFFAAAAFSSSPYRLLRPYTKASSEKLIGENEHRRSVHDTHWQILIHDRKNKVPDFYIDQIPITLRDYQQCTAEGLCFKAHYDRLYKGYEKNPLHGIFPATFITWVEAEQYCEAYGGHLPTYYQWDLAAGYRNGFEYPWGNEEPSLARANYDSFYHDLTPAGWLPSGATPEGVLDMAGNVREWILGVEDRHFSLKDTRPWQEIRDEINGKYAEENVLLKGGGAMDPMQEIRNESLMSHWRYSGGYNRGFRCVYEIGE